MSSAVPVELELQTLPPRRLTPRWEGWNGWGYVRLTACLWLATFLSGSLGFWLPPNLLHVGIGLRVLAGLLLLATGLLSVRIIKNLVIHALLVKEGAAVVAAVLENEARPDASGFGGFHDVYYRFTTTSGEDIQGCWKHAEPPLWESEAGDRVTVLYLPRNPRTNVAYACSLFRTRPSGSEPSAH